MGFSSKITRRIVSGRDKRAVFARRLFGEIVTGATAQQKLYSIFERHFFDSGFSSGKLFEIAGRFNGSRKQVVELQQYAKRLAKNRENTLSRYNTWGIKESDLGKPMEKTPSKESAKRIFYNFTAWSKICGKVEMIATIEGLAFIIEGKDYKEIINKEFPATKKAKAFFFGGNTKIPIMIFPSRKNAKKYLLHERTHSINSEIPLTKQMVQWDKNRFNEKTFERAYRPNNLILGAKSIGREMLDELIANLAEGSLESFEKKYKRRYLGDFSLENLNKKTAREFMENEKGHKRRILKAAKDSIAAVRNALSQKVQTADGKIVNVIEIQQLTGLLANIRDIEKVPKRLPILIELRKAAMKKK